MTNWYNVSLKQSNYSVKLFFIAIVILLIPVLSNAQCTPGTVITAHSSSTYDFLDPDADGYISESGAAFTSDTTELIEFEVIPYSTTGWIAITDVSETDGDLTPTCGNTDLVNDKNGGDFAFYNIIDTTAGSPNSGDEYIIIRFRLAKDPNGNFGYNFLFDTDNNYGAGTDPNSTCGNNGFEREVQYANAGSKKGVSAYDVDGATTMSPLSPACSQCVPIADIQISCAAIAGDSIPGAVPPDDDCNVSDPVFVSFGLALSYLGVGSDIAPEDLYIASATASSGNATSVLGGGNAADIGGIDGDVGGCPTCVSLSGCALFDCQTDCINAEFQGPLLPIELSYFEAKKVGDDIVLNWETQQEINSDYFIIQRSFEGRTFENIGEVQGAGNTSTIQYYQFIDNPEKRGVIYYRLKIVDNDRSYEYSDLVTITTDYLETEVKVTVFPNPASKSQNELTIKWESPASEFTISIHDNLGNTLYEKHTSIYGLTTNIDVANLGAGVYYIILNDGSRVQTHRFVRTY